MVNNGKWTRRDFVVVTATAAAGIGVLGSPTLTRATEATTVALPGPKTEGQVCVAAALKMRRSFRVFEEAPLSLEDISQLCWAAQGVTGPGGHRAAPSAHGIFPLELYVAAGAVADLASGLYHYTPADHALALISSEDKRPELDQKGVAQPWNPTSRAPVVFVISGNIGKMTGSFDPLVKARAVEFMWAEAGLAARGFFLEATARGLASVFTGGIRPKEARAVLGLPPSEEVLAVLPVGRRTI